MRSFNPIFDCFGFLILPMLFTWLMARWILGPISQAARAGRGRTQYRIIDFFCLIVEMQAVCAVVVTVTDRDEPQARYLLLIFGVLAVLALWVGAVQTLSRAGILDPRRRTVFNWLVMPTASVGSLVLVPLVAGLIRYSLEWPDRKTPIGLWLLAAVLAIALPVSKSLADWVLAEVADQQKPDYWPPQVAWPPQAPRRETPDFKPLSADPLPDETPIVLEPIPPPHTDAPRGEQPG